MADEPGEQDAIDHEVERALDRQRWTIETARVAVVFCAGIGASVSAAAWQTLGANPFTVTAGFFLGTSVLFLLSSFMSDHQQAPKIEEIVNDATQGGYSAREAITSYNRSAARYNEKIVSRVLFWSKVQALAALLAAALAAVTMMMEVK